MSILPYQDVGEQRTKMNSQIEGIHHQLTAARKAIAILDKDIREGVGLTYELATIQFESVQQV